MRNKRNIGVDKFMDRDIKRKVGAWGLFLLFFLFLQLANTSYWKVADLAYVSLGIAFVTVVSILVVCKKKWRRLLMNPPVGYTRSKKENRPLQK